MKRLIMEPLISFIIPAYNAAPYLEECLDSVYQQSAVGYYFEVIVVDDGSTDHTSSLLASYQQTHRDLNVVSQENLGRSRARTVGLQHAKGKYICFIDADDHLTGAPLPLNDMLEKEVDILSFNLFEVNEKGECLPFRRYFSPYYQVFSPAREFMRGRNLMPCVWAYFFRRAFLQEKHLTFMDGIYHEDEDFSVRAFAVADSFMALNLNWYERVLRKESITTTTDVEKQKKKLRDMVTVLEGLEALAQSDDELRGCMQYKLDYLAVDTLRILLRQKHKKVFRKEIVGRMRTIGYFPLRDHSEWKYTLFRYYTRMVL